MHAKPSCKAFHRGDYPCRQIIHPIFLPKLTDTMLWVTERSPKGDIVAGKVARMNN